MPTNRKISPNKIIISEERKAWSNLPQNQWNKWERFMKYKAQNSELDVYQLSHAYL